MTDRSFKYLFNTWRTCVCVWSQPKDNTSDCCSYGGSFSYGRHFFWCDIFSISPCLHIITSSEILTLAIFSLIKKISDIFSWQKITIWGEIYIWPALTKRTLGRLHHFWDILVVPNPRVYTHAKESRTHVKDPVVHVGARWNTKRPSMHFNY